VGKNEVSISMMQYVDDIMFVCKSKDAKHNGK